MRAEKIDFVLTWVDGDDEKWKNEFNQHQGLEGDTRENRFRNWDNLQYLFRAFETFTPWVNKIYFVTYGHTPVWLNTQHPKLVIVKHEDFLDEKNLPLFNSCAIEVNLHRIKGLGEKFVYFNDDTFILKPISSKAFFKKGLPVNACISNVVQTGDIAHIQLNNIDIINKHFYKKKNTIIFRNLFKWFHPGYGSHSLRTLFLMNWPNFTGFKNYHHPQPFLKSTFETLWQKEASLLSRVSASKFRNYSDVSQYIFRYWQFATGNFSPEHYKRAYKKRKYVELRIKEDAIRAAKLIESNKYEMFCANDAMSKGRLTDKDISEADFIDSRNVINTALETVLPNKSSFELD
jgi:hypothetical protein